MCAEMEKSGCISKTVCRWQAAGLCVFHESEAGRNVGMMTLERV